MILKRRKEMEKTRLVISGFEDERDPYVVGGGQLLKLEMARKATSPRGFRRSTTAGNLVIFPGHLPGLSDF